jgi:hypothetical protein
VNELLVAALDYAARRWPVLWLHAPTDDGGCTCRRDCGSPGKHPRTRHGLREATTDAGLIRGWWLHSPNANVGLATGTAHGFVALDLDNEAAKRTVLELASGCEVGGLVVRTGRGEQRWFLVRDGVSIGNRSRFLGVAGLDVRGLGGYVVAPPSVHVSGRRYAFAGGRLELVPEWLLAALSAPAVVDVPRSSSNAHDAEWESVPLERELSYGRAVLARRCASVRDEPVGSRNYALLRAARTVAGFVASETIEEDIARAELLAAARDVGLGELEALRTIRSGFERGRTRPLYPPTGAAA